ncbi:MAG: AI-2E family transporter, partial [Dolichospermum sp.]
VVLVLLLSIIMLGAIGVILLPLILEQLNELANLLPYWIESGTQQIEALQNWASTQKLPVNLSGLAAEFLGKISAQLQSFTGKILGFALDTIGNLFNLIITIVLTIYLVLNGESLWDGIYLWFPAHITKKVRELLREDFNNYFIGQATLGAILAMTITLAFVLLRVPLSLLFGLGIGLFSLFPFG